MAESDVRRDILAAATTLFARQGYASTSVREVVQAAGVTKPTLYYWFDNKEALFREVVETYLLDLATRLGSELAIPGSVRERFERFTRAWLDYALSQRESFRLLIIAQHPVDSEQPTVDLMQWHLRGIEELAAVLASGVATQEVRADIDFPTAAVTWLGTVNHILMGVLHGVPYDPQVVDRMLDLYFNGVARK